mgnify:CR=1 FL=1
MPQARLALAVCVTGAEYCLKAGIQDSGGSPQAERPLSAGRNKNPVERLLFVNSTIRCDCCRRDRSNCTNISTQMRALEKTLFPPGSALLRPSSGSVLSNAPSHFYARRQRAANTTMPNPQVSRATVLGSGMALMAKVCTVSLASDGS